MMFIFLLALVAIARSRDLVHANIAPPRAMFGTSTPIAMPSGDDGCECEDDE